MIAGKSQFKINDQKGAAAVEFALVLPLLLIFIFGIIEFGLFLYNQQVITNGVREGCRIGVIMRQTPRTVSIEDQLIRNETARIVNKVGLITFGTDTFDAGDVIVYGLDTTIAPHVSHTPRVSTDLQFGENLMVKATFSYKFLFLSTVGIGPINLNPVSIMKME